MFARVNGTPVFYETRGRGRPFIMLHGSPSDHTRALSQVEPAFKGRQGWRRLYPDLPGHGRSPGSPKIRDMDGYLRLVLGFVDALSSHGPFCIGGISFGAYLALAVTRKRRTRVAGLLLSVPEISHSPVEDQMDRRYGTPSIQTPQEVAPRLPKYVEDTAWLESLAFRDVSFDLYRGHAKVRVPALFLFGRRDAPFRAGTYWPMLCDFPEASFAVLGGAGHRLWTDRNEVACALTRDWLDRVEAGNRRG